MGETVTVPDGTDVLRALDRAGVEYLTVRETKAVAILGPGVLWVEVVDGHLQSADTLRLRPVEPADPADADTLLARFRTILTPNDTNPPR